MAEMIWIADVLSIQSDASWFLIERIALWMRSMDKGGHHFQNSRALVPKQNAFFLTDSAKREL